MTAASPVCSPTSSHSTQSLPVCLPACHRHLRKGKDLQTKLHLRSAPGVWLLLGVVVVLVGLSVAVAGYVSAAPKPVGGRGSTHSERMKLAGPMVMGVGLFIFICAATLLYENRDREDLRRETPDDLEDLKGGSGWEDSQEQPSFGCQEQWEDKDGQQGSWATPAHRLPLSNHNWGPPVSPSHNRHSISGKPSPPPPPDAGGRDIEKGDREETEKEGRSTLLARVLHHQEPTPHPTSPCLSISHSSVYSDSCNSSEIHFNIRTDSPLPPQHWTPRWFNFYCLMKNAWWDTFWSFRHSNTMHSSINRWNICWCVLVPPSGAESLSHCLWRVFFVLHRSLTHPRLKDWSSAFWCHLAIFELTHTQNP